MQKRLQTSPIALSFVRPLLLFITLLLLTMPLYAAPSDLDPTWGEDGVVEVDFDGDGEGINRVHKAAADPDGKIVVIGNYGTIAVTRFNPNGQPDTNFGTDGTTFVPRVSPYKGMGLLEVGQIDFQSNGKLIIVGAAEDESNTDEEPSWSLVIIRLNKNGSLDTSFGSNGYTLIYPSAIEFGESNVIGNDSVIDLDIQPDDKIVIQSLGLTSTFVHKSLLTRLNADGTLDSSFGGNGVVAFDGYLSAFEIQGDGKLVVGMNSYSIAPIPECANSITIFVSRINTDGSPDLSFGENGIRQLLPYWHEHGGICDADNSYYHELRDLNILPDSQIIVNGYVWQTQLGVDTQFPYFVRLTTEGDPDPAFDSNGILIGGEGYRYMDTVVQANGKLLTAHGNPLGLSRHHSGGNLDTAWNGTGRSSIPGGVADFPAMDLLPNGNLMLSALYIGGNAPADNRVFRIIGDPAFGYTALSPQHRQKQVSTKANLKLTFPQPVTVNIGKIEIRRVSDFSLFESIPVTDGARVTGGGTNTITINPSVNFESNTKYYVLIDPNTFTNASGHPFSGVRELNEWHFTTGLNNFVLNSGFEGKGGKATRPAKWTVNKLTSTDRRICNVERNGKPDLIYAYSGQCAFRFQSNTVKARNIHQEVLLTDALAGQTLNLSAFVRTNGLTNSAKVQVMLTYADETTQTVNLNVPGGSKPYRKIQKSFELPKAATSAQVRIITGTSKGTLLIDDLSLTINGATALPMTIQLPAAPDLRGQ